MLHEIVEAGEILTTGTCPLNCRYCYIPKTELMKGVHNQIVEDLQSNKTIDRLHKLYGDSLKSLGFWGTEPTLTMDILTSKIPYILECFPKLEKISYSTSGVTDPKIVYRLVKKINDQQLEHTFTIDHQISLDGPEWITDANRMKGVTETVMDGALDLVHRLNEIEFNNNLKIEIGWKPTMDTKNMREFLTKPYKIPQYIGFYAGLIDTLIKHNTNPSVGISDGFGPTLVVPGKYTSEDGRVFTAFLREWHKYSLTSYTDRLNRILVFDSTRNRKRQFTCSGGDSNLGFDGNIHICHRTFYMNHEDYVKSVLEGSSSIGDPDNWDVSLYNRGIIDFMKKNFIIDVEDSEEIDRFLYVMRGHHDFWQFQMSYIKAMMTELVYAGQADPSIIEKEGLLELFGRFILVGLNCPMENLLNTGSINLVPVSLLRLWGNGAFQEILKTCVRKQVHSQKRMIDC